MAEGIPPWSGQRLSGRRKAALGRNQSRATGKDGGPADTGDLFFEGVLAPHRGRANAAGTDWQAATCRQIKSQIEKGSQMTIQRMCEGGKGSRAPFYRFDPDREPADEDLDLRDEIQRVALEFPCYGRPRITAELKRRGWDVGHRRVGRIMREDNLLCLRKRKFVVTTDSNHNLRVYPNLAGSMELTGLDQLWIADITLYTTGNG